MRCKGSRALRAIGWETLLHAWGSMLDYYDVPPPCPAKRDIAYWYGERPLNGLLAAAAWKVPGGWSLPEFTTEEPYWTSAKYGERVYPGVILIGRYWADFAGDDFRVGITDEGSER